MRTAIGCLNPLAVGASVFFVKISQICYKVSSCTTNLKTFSDIYQAKNLVMYCAFLKIVKKFTQTDYAARTG